jgi:hypothetical protein
MNKISLFVLLCAATTLAGCQQSTKGTATLKPDSGNFAQNMYRNEFFGFSYTLPKEWHKSSVSPSPLPSGAYYLFVGDRDAGHALLNRITIVADPESAIDHRVSTPDYLSVLIRAEVRQFHAEVTRELSSFSSGGSDFYRADYKWMNNGTLIYSSMVCVERNGYWLDWNFTTPSQQDLDDALNTLQHISFDNPAPRPR